MSSVARADVADPSLPSPVRPLEPSTTTDEEPAAPSRSTSPSPARVIEARAALALPIVVLDVTAASLAAVSLVREDATALRWSAAALYSFGGPTVHLARGRGWNALTSLALRGGLPAVGLVTGGLLGSLGGGSAFDTLATANVFAGIAALVGVVGASVLDATVLASADAPARTF